MLKAEMHYQGSLEWLVCGVESIVAVAEWLYLNRVRFKISPAIGMNEDGELDENVYADHATLYICVDQMACILNQFNCVMVNFLMAMKGDLTSCEAKEYAGAMDDEKKYPNIPRE